MLLANLFLNVIKRSVESCEKDLCYILKYLFTQMSSAEFGKLGFQGAEPLAVMFDLFASGKYANDIDLTRSLNPAIPTFEQWVTQNRSVFDKEFP